MKVNKVQPVQPVQPVVKTVPVVHRLQKPYEGTVDPAVWIHTNKFHTSTKEAFRGADYGTAIWRCETEFEYGVRQVKEMLLGGAVIGLMLGGIYLFATWFVEVAK